MSKPHSFDNIMNPQTTKELPMDRKEILTSSTRARSRDSHAREIIVATLKLKLWDARCRLALAHGVGALCHRYQVTV